MSITAKCELLPLHSHVLLTLFCERILSDANDVCHEGNTLLDTEEINMLVVLRMDRKFIDYMREIYPKLSGQNFNQTLE